MTASTQTIQRIKNQIPLDVAQMGPTAKSTAKRAKAMREAQASAPNKTQVAIEMMLGTLSHQLESLRQGLMEAHQEGVDVYDALNLTELCQAEIGRAASRGLDSHDGFAENATGPGSLIRGIASIYGDRDDYCSRVISSANKTMDVAFVLVELVEDGEVAA